MTSPLEESAEELVKTVASLDASIRRGLDLRDDLDRLIIQAKITRRMVWIVTIGFALDVLLTIVVAIVGYQAAQNTERIDSLVQVQHDSALCPLYRLFIAADTPANRARAQQQGQDMAERDRSFAVIRQSYAALNCKDK